MNDTKKILLVEDDPEIVENLTEFLRTEGYSVTSVPTQKETMELLDRDRFDLMLLDVTLKQGNGYSVCTAVKAKYDMPVIFLTALDDEFSVVTGLDMGADDYISKPFRPRELVSRMRSVLRRQGGHSPWSVSGISGSIRKKERCRERGRRSSFQLWSTVFFSCL